MSVVIGVALAGIWPHPAVFKKKEKEKKRPHPAIVGSLLELVFICDISLRKSWYYFPSWSGCCSASSSSWKQQGDPAEYTGVMDVMDSYRMCEIDNDGYGPAMFSVINWGRRRGISVFKAMASANPSFFFSLSSIKNKQFNTFSPSHWEAERLRGTIHPVNRWFTISSGVASHQAVNEGLTGGLHWQPQLGQHWVGPTLGPRTTVPPLLVHRISGPAFPSHLPLAWRDSSACYCFSFSSWSLDLVPSSSTIALSFRALHGWQIPCLLRISTRPLARSFSFS